MTNYWVVHMKNGTTLELGRRCGFIDPTEKTMDFLTSRGGDYLASIPYGNILWIEHVIDVKAG